MSKRHTCDKCRNYTPSRDADSPNDGKCNLIQDSNDDHLGFPNTIRTWDYEGYRSGAYVGPKFGCIHWEKKA